MKYRFTVPLEEPRGKSYMKSYHACFSRKLARKISALGQPEKKAQEDRINKAKDSKAEKAKDKDDTDIYEEEEFEIIEANSLDDLLSKVQTYSYNNAASRVMTDTERAVGTRVDFKG